MAKKPPSTPVTYKESWIVVCDKEKYALTGEQMDVLKQATVKGQRGLVWFDKFAISIPHISSIYLESKKPDIQYLPEGEPDMLPLSGTGY